MGRIFVTNRPNYVHRRFAESVGCDFFRVGHFIPENIPLISLPLNGLLNSSRLPDADLFFSESIMDYYPVYYKNPEGKKVILVAEDTLFQLPSMPGFKRNYILKLFRSADGFVAISELCRKYLSRYVRKPVKVAYPFPHAEFFHVKADLDTKNILFIGRNDPSKGFPELVEAVKLLREGDKEWNLYLIGGCSKGVRKEEGINPLGFVKSMVPWIGKCTYYVHPAYFDPCPATVFEAMNAGMVPVITGNVGQADIFLRNRMSGLILNNNKPETIAGRLHELSLHKRGKISLKARNLSKRFREKERVKMFAREFEALVDEI